MNLSIKKTKIIIFFVLIFFVVLKFFNTPYNFYSILNWNYERRMEQNYGFCKNESWGFYNHVIKKFDLSGQEITIINDEGHVTLENLFDIKKSKNNKSNYLKYLPYTWSLINRRLKNPLFKNFRLLLNNHVKIKKLKKIDTL